VNPDLQWTDQFKIALDHGYLEARGREPRQYNPRVVVNDDQLSMLHVLRAELSRSNEFLFSVAFVSPRAIALLKQEIVEFAGNGTIVTSDYLSFNSPAAFTELLALRDLGIDVRRHRSSAFHPKGYIFKDGRSVTALVGSSNLTHTALAQNHEWNLKVSAAPKSDLANQFDRLIMTQIADSEPLTSEWIEAYAKTYTPPAARPARTSDPATPGAPTLPELTQPNKMQERALEGLAQVRQAGEKRAIIISATGTGKTILSALDVRAFNPRRLLFVVHREQILDKSIEEYQRVLGGVPTEYGKLSGGSRQSDCRYVFATVQTLSRPEVLAGFDRKAFDYVIFDEAHRAAAPTSRQVLDHFDPTFLLGMTATPERMDNFNVFELFDHNVPYEIRLNEALEQDMLAPFHYYGIADITFDDGTVVDGSADLNHLIAPSRIKHLLWAIETYGQAAVPPRGLIFCSGQEEAQELSNALNESTFRDRRLRTVALTGNDTNEHRNAMIRALEQGDLDYILSVNVLNEGIDIPSVNQIIMLRQTQSAIVFVQQLGRGLRKAEGKDYLVVIDFIGNYSTNFLIPIALFGDESLNKESLRQHLISAEEVGVLPGLSSVRFDKVAQDRVLRSIASTRLDDMRRLKDSLRAMRDRVGGVPALWDFLRFDSTDPVLLATRKEHYPALVESVLKESSGLRAIDGKLLQTLSHEVFPAKRPHDLAALSSLLRGPLTVADLVQALVDDGVPTTRAQVESAINSLTLEHHHPADRIKYVAVAERRADGTVALSNDFMAAYLSSNSFEQAVDDLIRTGRKLVADRFDASRLFTPGRQYTRKDAAHLLNWPRSFMSIIYGYRVDTEAGICPIFVTLDKPEDVSAGTAYEDELLDSSTMRWFTRSGKSYRRDRAKIDAIVNNRVRLHVFVKKDDLSKREESNHYYLGEARSSSAEETTMANGDPVMRMLLHFDQPIDAALFDYFHPEITG
jgi:superfamily II DNA or RNA helicase/HKD family nuclease